MMNLPNERIASDQPAVTIDDLKALLGDVLFSEVVARFVHKTAAAVDDVERRTIECLRYLYLVSKYREQLSGLFLPVEQEIDEIWHYLILQTREYRMMCEERLPGRFFIHHRSISYQEYQKQPSREQAIRESLRWIPLYRNEFGPFDEGALSHWTMVRFLHQQLGLSMKAIAELDG